MKRCAPLAASRAAAGACIRAALSSHHSLSPCSLPHPRRRSYKSRGPRALAADNVFHPLTYDEL